MTLLLLPPSDIIAWHLVDGWLSPTEADRLAALASLVPAAGTIVEIGTYRGRATAALAIGAQQSGCRLISIDHYAGVAGVDADWSSSPALVEHNLAHVLAGRARPGWSADLRAAASADVAGDWPAGELVDLLFIDGSHDQQSVEHDLAAWWGHVAPAGTVALHDYCAGHGAGVMAAVAPYISSRRARLVGHAGLIAELRKVSD